MKRIAATILCFLVLSYNCVYASNSTSDTSQKLIDVICEPADSIVYEELQAFIDEYHLPGYRVEGKKIYRYYTTFDWLGAGKNSAEAGRIYAEDNYMHIIFDEEKYYFVGCESVNSLEDISELWRAVIELFQGETQIEIDGTKETITELTCFVGNGTDLLLYMMTADCEIYVRHYDNRYVDSDTGETILYRDYLLENFVVYVDRYAVWLRLKYPDFTPGASQIGHNPFAVYMNDGAPASPPPSMSNPDVPIEKESHIIWYILIGTSAVLAAGTVAVLVWRKKRKVS